MNGILNNSNEAKLNSNYYNKFWQKYELNNEDKIRSLFIQRNLKKLNIKNTEILDLGCGYGWMSNFLKKFGNYTGVDFSNSSIEFANKNFKENGNFILADEMSLTLGLPIEKKFDIIVCSEVIEHVVDQISFVQQIQMFLKPNGHLFLTTPNQLCWNNFTKIHDRTNMQPVENWLSFDDIKKLFVEDDWSIIKSEGRILFPALNNKYMAFASRFIDNLTHALYLEDFYMYFLKKYSLYQMLVIKKK